MQVMLNLLSNAAKFCAPVDGRITVTLREQAGMLRVTVRDNGRGIAREALERVLSGEEDGLGLANVHQRLTAFYGEGVRLKSGVFGTVVRLQVPA